MREQALKVFRQPPGRLNCAQSVLHAWREVSGDTSITLADLKPFGAGRAPDGICGALHSACLVAPDHADALKQDFSGRLGSLYCRELRAARVHPCETCVSLAAELLQTRAAALPKP